jgi:hypothetical protein
LYFVPSRESKCRQAALRRCRLPSSASLGNEQSPSVYLSARRHASDRASLRHPQTCQSIGVGNRLAVGRLAEDSVVLAEGPTEAAAKA